MSVETQDGIVKARVPADIAVRTGDTVGLSLNAARLSLFERASGRAIRTSVHEAA